MFLFVVSDYTNMILYGQFSWTGRIILVDTLWLFCGSLSRNCRSRVNINCLLIYPNIFLSLQSNISYYFDIEIRPMEPVYQCFFHKIFHWCSLLSWLLSCKICRLWWRLCIIIDFWIVTSYINSPHPIHLLKLPNTFFHYPTWFWWFYICLWAVAFL